LTEANANTYVSAYRSACENVGGGGATFSGGVSTDELNISDSTWTYCAKYSCNGCTSVEIQAQKQAVIDSCTTECFTSNFTCSATGALSYQINISGCSETPITTGECAESSSSIESSSSGESSSSVASSSSVEGSSSASEPTSSTSVHSSSSIAGNGALADICNANCLGPHDHILFSTIPKMDGIPSYSSYSCYDGLLLLKTNISRIAVSWSYCSHDDQCSTYDRLTVYWCNYGDSLTSVGCAPFSGGTYFLCDSATCYYSFQDTLAAESYVLPSNISVSQIYSLADSAARLAGYSDRAAYANYCKSIYSSSSATPISSSSGDGSSSSEESHESSSSSNEETDSSSSGNDEISSSSASDAGSSNSTEINSSTSGPESGESSGSVSSSSEESHESSSSGGEETGSSSSGNDESSSSSASGIDSSCPDCETNVPSAEAVYTSDQIFNSGLENMEDGKCYSLNPDRGTQYGWINNNAQDSWWWVETPCDGSAPEEETTSAGCVENQRGSNAVYTSADCFSSGLDNMEEGKCYSLNPDRGTQYGWINNNAQDSWWWVETPCEAEEYANTCPDGSTLYKKTTAQAIEASSENNSTYTLEMPKVFYDALGRKTTDSPKTKRHLFESKREYKTPTDINLWSEETSIYLESISVECGNNFKGEWVCEEVSGESVLKKSGADSSGIDTCGILGVDYGIFENNGSLRGGRTCVHTAFKVLISKHPNSEIGLCKDGSKLLKVSFTLKTTPSTLSRNEPFHVFAGYVFHDSDYTKTYTTTKEDEIAMQYHELGHVKYNTCIKFPEIKKAYSFDCVCESELEKIYNETIDTLKKLETKETKNLWMIPEIYFTKNMEQVVMRKLTYALKIKPILIFILLAAGICFAEDTIAAKFCFYADTSLRDSQIVDSVWKLSVYKQVIPLMVTIQTECNPYYFSFNAELISKVKHLSFFTDEYLPAGQACAAVSDGKSYKCTVDINEKYRIYDYLSFSYKYKDSTKIPELFNKVLPLEWSLYFAMGKQEQRLSGKHYVYVSGFCNEEQRARIKELKKEKEERIQELEKEEEEKRIQELKREEKRIQEWERERGIN